MDIRQRIPGIRPGHWIVECDRCGREIWSDEARKTWDHLIVCIDDWEPRHPQEFIKGRADRQSVPNPRPAPDDVFVATGWTDTLAATAIDTSHGGWGNFTMRMLIPASATSTSGSKLRLTFQAGPSYAQEIQALYVGHGASSGDAYDFESTPVQGFFNGAGSIVIPTGTTQTTDEINFAYVHSKPLLVAWYQPTDTGADAIGYRTATTGFNSYFKAGDDAATQNASGYSAQSTDRLYAIRQIEVLV